jgi:CDP-diacylglycerol--serine O-phosphatidyltransferase
VDYRYVAACYLIALSMIFDALDGRLARITRHTTDFGGQLDSLADAISFGAAPAFIALHVFRFDGVDVPPVIDRLIWAIGALYVACALIRLARFNVSNEHGEENHQSFLGLPSPGAAGAVLALVLVQQDFQQEMRLAEPGAWRDVLVWLTIGTTVLIPIVLAASALLMVSGVRYPHVVNRYGRGNKRINRLILAVVLLLALVVAHRYTLFFVGIAFLLAGPLGLLRARGRRGSGPTTKHA